MIFINHLSLPNIHHINALSPASSLLMSIKTPTAAGLDLPTNVRYYSLLCQHTSHSGGHGPCQQLCASLHVHRAPPYSLSIAETRNKQSNLLIAFSKLKGTKLREAHFLKRPGSSLKNAGRASRAAGLDLAFRKEGAEYRPQPFIKLVPCTY